MSIPFNRYVDIQSGVGGGASVRQRELIMRVFSTSQLISPDSVLQFDDADSVGIYFGTSSQEYKRAVSYFGYVSPTTSSPRRIAFARDSTASSFAMVIGNNSFKAIAVMNAVVSGQFTISLAGVDYPINNVDLSAAVDMAGVAALVQTAIQAQGSPLLADATVTFGIGRPSGFVVALPSAPDGSKFTVESTVSGTNDLAALMGLDSAVGGLSVAQSDAMPPVESFQRAQRVTNNFGSFVFQAPLVLAQVVELAEYNMSLNVMYQYHAGVQAADAQAWYDELKGYAGVGLTLSPIATEYPEQIPCAILAATDYSKRDAVQNYMYKMFAGVTSSVSSGQDANKYDAIRVNYYGDTSTGGQRIEFYQRGKLMGTSTAPVDMNVYGNEQWLRDYAGTVLMRLQLSVGRIPANLSGIGAIYNTLQAVVDEALTNGVISAGKTLNTAQKVFIGQQTGDNKAWQKVQSAGYVLDVRIEQVAAVDGSTEYKAVYQLIYSKDDAVRKIEGTHQLI